MDSIQRIGRDIKPMSKMILDDKQYHFKHLFEMRYIHMIQNVILNHRLIDVCHIHHIMI
jgi:Lon protease-like protein